MPFIDVTDIEVVGIMRERLAHLASLLGLRIIDASTILGSDREFTQAVAREIWGPGYAGIVSPSVLGHPHTNWTAFESGYETNAFRVELTVVKAEVVTLEHPDLIDALNALHMSIDRETLLMRANPGDLAPADASEIG